MLLSPQLELPAVTLDVEAQILPSVACVVAPAVLRSPCANFLVGLSPLSDPLPFLRLAPFPLHLVFPRLSPLSIHERAALSPATVLVNLPARLPFCMARGGTRHIHYLRSRGGPPPPLFPPSFHPYIPPFPLSACCLPLPPPGRHVFCRGTLGVLFVCLCVVSYLVLLCFLCVHAYARTHVRVCPCTSCFFRFLWYLCVSITTTTTTTARLVWRAPLPALQEGPCCCCPCFCSSCCCCPLSMSAL